MTTEICEQAFQPESGFKVSIPVFFFQLEPSQRANKGACCITHDLNNLLFISVIHGNRPNRILSKGVFIRSGGGIIRSRDAIIRSRGGIIRSRDAIIQSRGVLYAARGV